MSRLLCRLCQSSLPSDTTVSLFSQTAAQQRLPGRITDLLEVPVAQADGHICRKCKHKLERLKKAAEELENFRSEAKTTYSTLVFKRNELKVTG